jgi:hypothetical protein
MPVKFSSVGYGNDARIGKGNGNGNGNGNGKVLKAFKPIDVTDKRNGLPHR